VRAALEERLDSEDRAILMLDQALRRLREDGVHDGEKLPAMEAEVSGLPSLLGETSASVQKAARDMDLVRAAVTDQRMAHGRDIRALEEEMGRMGKAIEATRRSLGQHESELKAAIGDFDKRAAQEQSEVSVLKDVLERLDGKHEELRETVARLQEAITAGQSKVKKDLGNGQGELAKMKEEIRGMKLKPNPSTQIAPHAADAIAPPPQKAVAPARKCSSSPPRRRNRQSSSLRR
jgi:DNA repair exonuclease SbcCD ATPase subunit